MDDIQEASELFFSEFPEFFVGFGFGRRRGDCNSWREGGQLVAICG